MGVSPSGSDVRKTCVHCFLGWICHKRLPRGHRRSISTRDGNNGPIDVDRCCVVQFRPLIDLLFEDKPT